MKVVSSHRSCLEETSRRDYRPPARFLSKLLYAAFVIPTTIIAPVGGWIAFFHCLVHRKKPIKPLLLIVLLPFGFAWYYSTVRHRAAPAGARE
jgi:hypothetical protein